MIIHLQSVPEDLAELAPLLHISKAFCHCPHAALNIKESQEDVEGPSRSGSKHSKISVGFDQSNTFSLECQDIDIEHGYHLHLADISNGLGELGPQYVSSRFCKKVQYRYFSSDNGEQKKTGARNKADDDH